MPTNVTYPSVELFRIVPETGFNMRYYAWTKRGQRQPKPWKSPLFVEMEEVKAQGNGGWSNTDVSRGASFMPRAVSLGDTYTAQAYDKAYNRLLESMKYVQAGWGINFVQWQQAHGMILKRVLQLTAAARSLRKGDISGFLGHLGVTSAGRTPQAPIPRRRPTNPITRDRRDKKRRDRENQRNRRRNRKRAADIWLEYSFGWVPLIQDIYTSIDILQSATPHETIRGRGSVYWERVEWLDDQFPSHKTSGFTRVLLQTRVRITNPNLYLATQLGLTNPAAIVWDGIPFSFVVDWFIPVSKFLNSFSHFYGLTLEDSFATYSGRWVEGSTSPYTWNGVYKVKKNTGRYVRRQPVSGFSYRFTPKGIRGIGAWHAATSTSLLIQQLRALR